MTADTDDDGDGIDDSEDGYPLVAIGIELTLMVMDGPMIVMRIARLLEWLLIPMMMEMVLPTVRRIPIRSHRNVGYRFRWHW